MSGFPDFVIRSPDQRPLLVVEAKNRANASLEWAAQMRRNLIAHGVLPDAPYFLLALPDKLFLWKRTSSPSTVPPDYVADTEQMLRPYLETLRSSLGDLSESSFETVVRLWLDDLVEGRGREEAPWLDASGLGDTVRNGIVTTRMAA